MDLLERGRSLSELGRTLRWSDLKALLLHLPPTAHFRRRLAPDEARRARWDTPEVLLLGQLYDAWEVETLLRRGVAPEGLPERGIVARIIDPQVREPVEPARPRPSAADIRQRVKARET